MLRFSVRSFVLACVAAGSVALPVAGQSFDHSAFDALLKRHVVNGMVDYDAFKREPSFDAYLSALANTDPGVLPRDEELALWINAYNAYTIQLINKHGERESIRNINKTLFFKFNGPWDESLATVGGKSYTLDHIEHKIIRPEFKEPRIHFALVCAAMGCPPLRREAYTGDKLDAQLREQGMIFITASPNKTRVDVASKILYHSSIFGYYKDDFGGSIKAMAQYLSLWFPPGSAERALLASGDFKAVETEYDWTLNSQENAQRIRQKAQ